MYSISSGTVEREDIEERERERPMAMKCIRDEHYISADRSSEKERER